MNYYITKKLVEKFLLDDRYRYSCIAAPNRAGKTSFMDRYCTENHFSLKIYFPLSLATNTATLIKQMNNSILRTFDYYQNPLKRVGLDEIITKVENLIRVRGIKLIMIDDLRSLNNSESHKFFEYFHMLGDNLNVKFFFMH
ncbi:hypothetical protein [Paenibacillus brasilensis]|uniref:Uncharacterized protein n=1 Tax=Paenibacillus brasilensis TaxID=128574 RepID=A0ABU0L7N9_9BACL|nr:hypothetical protein [Paenibacillus brasilensis]MDQ0497295.1 hypothetical protein [Paenibacillus brasilensis]